MEETSIIELGEILSVRLRCKNCGATLSLPIAKITEEAVGQLNACPLCEKYWTKDPGFSELGQRDTTQSIESLLLAAMRSIVDLTTRMRRRTSEPTPGDPPRFEVGFDVTIEIKKSTPPR
jgi:hypothetical protein